MGMTPAIILRRGAFLCGGACFPRYRLRKRRILSGNEWLMLGGLNVLLNLSYLDVEVLALEGCEAVCVDIWYRHKVS